MQPVHQVEGDRIEQRHPLPLTPAEKLWAFRKATGGSGKLSIAYQSLIASVLHKYVSGTVLSGKKEG